MTLLNENFYYFDAQTTAMSAAYGHLLEVAWSTAGAAAVESHFVAQPEGCELPPRIQKITGITSHDLHAAQSPEQIASLLRGFDPPVVLIHYAQFEKPFLERLFAPEPIPFEIFCTYQMAKRLWPDIPSKTVRGLAGFLGAPLESDMKRASCHVQATRVIWQAMAGELERQGITQISELRAWIENTRVAKASRYRYPLERKKRLELPDEPGVYRFLNQDQRVLYVGKATSLRDRVNSYFRGQKNRHRQKLEMLTQAWDLNVTCCATPLEAALLESDEIKRHNPAYNICLKEGERRLVFYDRALRELSYDPSSFYCVGPFTSEEVMAPLIELAQCIREGTMRPSLFFTPLEESLLNEGFALYRDNHPHLPAPEVVQPRMLLAYALIELRRYREPEGTVEEVVEEQTASEQQEALPTAAEVADKFARLLRRSARAYQRSRRLKKLLNADIEFTDRGRERRLCLREGHAVLTVSTYDRLRVLMTELERVRSQEGGRVLITAKRGGN